MIFSMTLKEQFVFCLVVVQVLISFVNSFYVHYRPIKRISLAICSLSKVSESYVLPIQDRLEQAQHVETLSQQDCDQLLATCVAQDEWDLVLSVLDLMKSHGLSQVHSTYTASLKACFESSNAASGKEIFHAMQQAKYDPNSVDLGYMIMTICRKEKDWKECVRLMREHDEASVDMPLAAYDAVLSCMLSDASSSSSSSAAWKEAVRLIRTMESPIHKTRPAASTYRTAIECCVASQQAEQAVQLLQLALKQREWTPTIYSFELVVSALAKKAQWRRALQILQIMDQLKVQKTVVIYNSVLTACAKAKEVVQAKNLLAQMKKSGCQPDIVSYNAVLSACASTRRWKDALAVLDQCHREPGVSPDIYTYTNAMRACAKGGRTRQALALLQVAKDKRLPVDTYCYTAAIEACAKAKMWIKALELLDEMQVKGIEPSEVTYSVTISACGNGGQWRKALDLLTLMKEKGMSVNVITYNAAITALAKAAKQASRDELVDHDTNENGELWKKALGLLQQMRQDGLEPDGFSYSSAISCCGADGRWREALDLMEQMRAGGPRTQPNKIAYTAAISSCGRTGRIDDALRLFRQMKDQGLSADRVAYNALFSALRTAKRPEGAMELWDEMLGVRKSNITKIATAADESTSPDIITVTDAIGALSSPWSDGRIRLENVDKLFSEAVKRGIVLRSDALDSRWEFDLSGMSFPVARAACRFILKRIHRSSHGKVDHDLTFITGIGAGKDRKMTSLREYIQEILLQDFDPPLDSSIPKRAQGTIQVDKEAINHWIDRQSCR